MALNKVMLIGNLGADPEVRFTQGGQPVCSIRMATSETWTGKDGQKQERTEWHAVTVWGKTAESCGQYLHKGSKVFIEGRLQSREYDDKDGVKRKVWEIQADRVDFLDPKGGGASDAGSGGSAGGGGQGGVRNDWGGNNQQGGGVGNKPGGRPAGGGGFPPPGSPGGGPQRGFDFDEDPIPF